MSRLKIRQEKQHIDATIKQATAAPFPQHYADTVWDYEEGQILEFKHLLNHKNPETQKAWGTAGANEYVRLIHIIGKTRKQKDRIKGMN